MRMFGKNESQKLSYSLFGYLDSELVQDLEYFKSFDFILRRGAGKKIN